MSTTPDLIAELNAADDRRTQATVAKDRAGMEAVFSADLRYVHSSGTDEDRATYIERATTGWYDYRKLESLRRDWQVHGDMALCHGDVKIEVVAKGNPKVFTSRYLQVWRREAGAWKLVALQSTPMPA
jgi:ketosteroid isomerase-like protein